MVVEHTLKNVTPSNMLTINEVAGLLHAHPSSVRRWVEQGLLKCYRFGVRGDRRFKAEHMDEVMEAGAQCIANGYSAD